MIGKPKSHLSRFFKAIIIIACILVGSFFLIKILPFNSIFSPFFHVYSKVYTKLIEPLIDDSERILIFAPHPDDETLSCGGTIQKALSQGKTVKVVFLTSGDSFGNDYEMTQTSKDSPKGVTLGYLRQKEALEATAILGLAKENVIFLGYLDRGLERMWWIYRDCDHSFRSPYTQTNKSPYLSSYTLSAPYCGDQVISDIQDILETFQPQTIYLPHASDLHTDHRATYNFVKEAIERLRQKGSSWVDDAKIYLYLVHFGRMKWPPLWGYAPHLRLYPPSQLMSTRQWTGFELTEEEISNKKKAVDQYRSQQEIRELLLAFVKTNEVFAIDVDYHLPQNEKITILDERGEFALPKLVGGGDIKHMEVIRNENSITLELHFDSGIPLRVRYRFFLIGYSEGEVVFRESYMLFDKKRPVRIQGDYLSSLPTVTNGKGWVALTFDFDHRPFPDALFLSAESSAPTNLMLDRLPWSMVIMENVE
jgi:LmbE family N-acetylglucosaminyl deacetylase